ncbi:MAG TPA: alpha-L-fucosidase [Opitutaceae bacterium]|nr:alpha-L-fucosidase [Opitutaceae bacterium]
MSLSRRHAIKILAGAVPAVGVAGAARAALPAEWSVPPIQPGPFQGTRRSLLAYQAPEWFRNAKFGIWAHWGPQSSVEQGDWYARNMYLQGSRQNQYHVEHYGHPSKVGYKDLIPNWKAAHFDADHLVGLYKKAGARYFMSMGVHHDNFDLWNSAHTRWNAVGMGPKRDVVGEFRDAARKHGLRFCVSDHLWITYKWFSVSHGSDREGPLAGVPYDGTNPDFADLYGRCEEIFTRLDWNEDGIPEAWKRHWFMRIKDLVDKYEPDLLYCDGHIPFEEWGLSLVAHLYNLNARRHGGAVEAVYTSKRREDSAQGVCVLDVERGLVDSIWPQPWQTDTCIGEWHYRRDIQYKTPKTVIDMLVDIVSRNGNLMLNFPLPNSGRLDEEELKILAEITAWMAVNREAIHDTRPWKIFGAGPGTQKAATKEQFNENSRNALTAEDVRFTTKGAVLYAFFMGWPDKEVVIAPLATTSPNLVGRISGVDLLGFPGKLQWAQNETGLTVQLPAEKPCNHAYALRIAGAI